MRSWDSPRFFLVSSSHKTSCNRILERFFKSNDPRKGPSVLYFPFRQMPPTNNAPQTKVTR